MLSLFNFFKQKLILHYRKIVFVILSPVLFFCFSFSSYAYSDYSHIPLNVNSVVLYNGSYFYADSSDDNVYLFSNPSYSLSYISFNCDYTDPFVIPVDVSVFDYYFISSVYAEASLISDFTFFPGFVRLNYIDHSNVGVNIPYSEINYYHLDTTSRKGFSFSCKLDLSQSSTISQFIFYSDSAYTIPANLCFEASVIALPKYLTSGDVNQAIVNAINNQTDSIMNAGSQFGGTTSGIQSGNDELSGYIDDYTEIEQSMHDKFVETQSALNGDFTGFSWGSLSTCLNWCSDYLQQIYLNSGDFKMMIVLPLLLGIALFFIGRGAVILANSNKSDKADNDK